MEKSYTPKISIMTPNYNHSQFIEKSISSVINQTQKPDEYIVIDDGSTDNSQHIIQKFQNISFLKPIYRKKNIGTVPNCTEILFTSRADFILFLAADDFLEPTLIEKYKKLLVKYPDVGFICAKSNKVDIKSNKIGTYKIPQSIPSGFIPPTQARKLICQYGPWFYGNTILLNRKKVIEMGGFNPNLLSYIDGYIYLYLALKYGLIYVDQVLSNYRRHEEGYSTDTYRNLKKLTQIETEVLSLMIKEPTVFDASFINRWQQRWNYLKFNAGIIQHKKMPILIKVFISAGAYIFFRWFDLFNLRILDVRAFLRECMKSKS